MADYVCADIPNDLKSLRACLRCSLLKSFQQFYENGCENCDHFLYMKDSAARVHEVYLGNNFYLDSFIRNIFFFTFSVPLLIMKERSVCLNRRPLGWLNGRE